VLDKDGATSQCSDKVDLGVVKEVVVPPFKARVRFLLNLKDDVTSKDAGGLITLAAELDLGAALDAAINVHVKDLAIHDRLLAEALLAAILLLHNLAFTAAIRAYRLEPLDHGTHLAHHCFHTVTITSRALPNSSLFTATTLALWADNRPLQGQLGHFSAVDVLKRDLVDVMNRFGLRWTALLVHTAAKHAAKAAAAKELSEQVLSRHAGTAASTAL
jgi:hypothetical protein